MIAKSSQPLNQASRHTNVSSWDERDIETSVSVVGGPDNPTSPETLVQSETWWINSLRVFLIGTLVLVATGISTATYKLLAHLEYENFLSEFETVANRISQTFLEDIKLKLWVSSFVSLSISKSSGAIGGFLEANSDFFGALSSGVGAITYWNRLGFSPLLWTENERLAWEAYVRQKMESKYNYSGVCYVCGEGMEVGNPDSIVNIPTLAAMPCGIVEKAGINGNVPERFCQSMPHIVNETCKCQVAQRALNASQTKINKASNRIFRISDAGQHVADNEPPPYSPIWEASPEPPQDALMFNQLSEPDRRQAIQEMIQTKLPTFSTTKFPCDQYQQLLDETCDQPQVTLFYPLLDTNKTGGQSVVGSLAIDLAWSAVIGFGDRVPTKSNGVLLVIENSIGQAFSFKIDRNLIVSYAGEGDLHDPLYEGLVRGSSFDEMRSILFAAVPKSVAASAPETVPVYKVSVYPSGVFKAQFVTHRPIYYTAVVAFIFIFTSAMFILYDIFVRRRQAKVMNSALQSNALVTSVFPDFIASRLMTENNVKGNNRRFSPLPFETPKHQIRNLLGRSGAMDRHVLNDTDPIADLFPDVTVIFADIAGFTAWCSERDPVQVFQLLETVYQTFDKIAIKHGVFKIETIGDCYVAATGLPSPQTDHAVRMSRFAFEILLHMQEMAASLETLLGPGTGSLTLRIGLHSGAVTGGVLRGEKARFQLFGDTMNTAARMQTTGHVNTIQATEATAELLIAAGYSQWITKRPDTVQVKGKGDMQTFWIDLATSPAENNSSSASGLTAESVSQSVPLAAKGSTDDSFERLVNWNADLLEAFLKKVVASRTKADRRSGRRTTLLHGSDCIWEQPIKHVVEVIDMSGFTETEARDRIEPKSVELDRAVRLQLRHYIERIASLYRENAFHNFEHASHVAMSANKIMKRILKPEGIDYYQASIKKKYRKNAIEQLIHISTFGISSDALMQFAAIFSALIHDVDHTGVSNAQLVKEHNQLATTYNNKCVAEQHSICTAWNLLMEEQFSALRACIYTSNEEERRFQQLVVNAVIATDIADNENQVLRKNRWYKAFYEANRDIDTDTYDISRKATIAFEYIIQASDVAHTMQHWHVYKKWNEKLFEERYLAYLGGREEKDPSLGWYEGELWFFDNYVIPLARKLETCGVFGVSSDEYLNYALANRHEWERRGRDMVEEFEEKNRRKYHGFSPEQYQREGGVAA